MRRIAPSATAATFERETVSCYAVACNRSIGKACPIGDGLFSYPIPLDGWPSGRRHPLARRAGMTTDLMLRGFESRTIRQPPPAPCATGVCGTREHHHKRRAPAGFSSPFSRRPLRRWLGEGGYTFGSHSCSEGCCERATQQRSGTRPHPQASAVTLQRQADMRAMRPAHRHQPQNTAPRQHGDR